MAKIGQAWADGAWDVTSWDVGPVGAWAQGPPIVPPTQSSIGISIGFSSFMLLVGRVILETWRVW